MGVLTKAVIRSKLGQPCKVQHDGHDNMLNIKKGAEVVLDRNLQVVKGSP